MKTTIVVLAILFLSTAGYSQNNKTSRFYFSLDGGLNKYTENTYYTSGLAMSLKGGYKLSNNSMAGIKFDYSANHYSDYSKFENYYSKVVSGGQIVDASVKAFFSYGNFKNSVKFRPYFTIAAGLEFIKGTGILTLNSGAISGSEFQTYLGMDFGIGLDYKFSENLSMYVQPGFKGIINYGNTSTSLKMGVTFNP